MASHKTYGIAPEITSKEADNENPDGKTDGNTGPHGPHGPQEPQNCSMPKRYLTVLLTCLGMLFVHAMRVNVAVTIVALIDIQHDPEPLNDDYEIDFSLDWSPSMVGVLHASFYIGYLITQVPGGYLCQILPSHRLFGCSILISCCLNLFLPVVILDTGYTTTCLVRGLQGLSEGLLFPSCYSVMRHWTTPEERSRMGAMVLTGVYTGPVIGLIASGWITQYLGWTHVFYFSGGCGILWFVLWLFLSYETPALHPKIAGDELKLIHDRQGETAIIYEHDKIPWKEILLSMPVNSLNVCNFARSFVFFFLLTNEPLFLNVFGFNLAENGLLSSLPHVLLAFFAACSGPVADLLINHTRLTTTHVRKLFTCGGFGVEGVCMLGLAMVSEGAAALVLLIVGVGMSGFTISGWQINHLDLAPRYASVLVGITTAVGTIAGIVNPIIVGWMTEDQTLAEWHHVFYMTAAVLLFAVIFYLMFGSGEKQRWSEPFPHHEIVSTEESPLKNPNFKTHHTQYGKDELASKSVFKKPHPSGNDGDTFDVRQRQTAQPGVNYPEQDQSACVLYDDVPTADINVNTQR